MTDLSLFPRRAGLGLFAASLLVSACTQAPGAAPTPSASAPSETVLSSQSPAPAATPTPNPSPARYSQNFEGLALGSTPAEFVDVTTEETTPAWVYKGNWSITADERGNHVFMHDDVREQPAVSFQRYRGTALGTANGQVPDKYFTEVACRPIKSPYNYGPTGDQGVQFFYVNYNTYLEVVIKPDQLEIWEAIGAEPKTTKGWKRLWGTAYTTKGGDVRRIGALVDLQAGTFTATLDGKPLNTVKSTLLTSRKAYVALRGIGNQVSFDDMVIEPR